MQVTGYSYIWIKFIESLSMVKKSFITKAYTLRGTAKFTQKWLKMLGCPSFTTTIPWGLGQCDVWAKCFNSMRWPLIINFRYFTTHYRKYVTTTYKHLAHTSHCSRPHGIVVVNERTFLCIFQKSHINDLFLYF